MSNKESIFEEILDDVELRTNIIKYTNKISKEIGNFIDHIDLCKGKSYFCVELIIIALLRKHVESAKGDCDVNHTLEDYYRIIDRISYICKEWLKVAE